MARRLSEKQYKELLDTINYLTDSDLEKIDNYKSLSKHEQEYIRNTIWLKTAIRITPDSTLGKESERALEIVERNEAERKIKEEKQRIEAEKQRIEEEKRLAKEKEKEERRKAYKPSGKRVKVKDVKPGYVYTFADMSIEDFYAERESEYTCARSTYAHFKEYHKYLDNQGLVIAPLRPYGDGRYWVELYSMTIQNQMKLVPTPPKSKGLCWERTGRKVWAPQKSQKTNRLMYPDEELIQVHSFPVGIYREGWELELLPDPEGWTTVSSSTPHTKEDDYVAVWDESDFKILVILGIISFVLLLAGPSAWSILIMMWIVAAAGFHSKHKKIRDWVLREREERKVRGSGLDDQFWWR